MQSPKGKNFKYAPGHGPAVPQECPETGSGWIMGGPFWSQPIHDQTWVQGVLDILEVNPVRMPLSLQLPHGNVVSEGFKNLQEWEGAESCYLATDCICI